MNKLVDNFDDIGVYVKPKSTPQLIVFYGQPGTGKTTAACHSESPVIIPVGSETGHERMHVPKYENKTGIDGLLFVEKCIKHLLTTEHNRKTLILDNIGEYSDLVTDDVIKKNPKVGEDDVKSLADYGYGRGNALVYPYFTRIFAGVRALQDKKDMDVIIIGHESHITITPPDGKYYQKIGINLQGGEKTNVRGLLERKADYVFYFQRVDKTRVSGEKKFGKDVRIATNQAPEITIATRETGLYFAKRREKMDDEYYVPYSNEETINKEFNNEIYKEIFNLIKG